MRWPPRADTSRGTRTSRSRSRPTRSSRRVTVIVAGVSLSLSGGFRLQGQEGLDALRLWADHIQQAGGVAGGPSGSRLPLRLIALDDGGRTDRARENVLRLLTHDRVDLLLGPHSGRLPRPGATFAKRHGKFLWSQRLSAEP